MPGQDGLGRADRAHQVQLPGALPDLLGELLEAVDLGPAEVVDEAVDAAEGVERGRDDALRLAGSGEVGGDVEVAGALVAAARRDDLRALCLEQPRGVERRCPRSRR